LEVLACSRNSLTIDLNDPSSQSGAVDNELSSAIHMIGAIVRTDDMRYLVELQAAADQRLAACFGCIANAISWLHDEAHIRHRDLKPAQVLLSRDGLWLTDFGVSTFITNLDDTATTGNENLTFKYRAPERAQGLPRGRAEDVFALGCIYLEMSYVLAGRPVSDLSFMPVRTERSRWSYEQHAADCLENWLKPLGDLANDLPDRFTTLLRTMLSLNPASRPSMNTVVSELTECKAYALPSFGTCCSTKDPVYQPIDHIWEVFHDTPVDLPFDLQDLCFMEWTELYGDPRYMVIDPALLTEYDTPAAHSQLVVPEFAPIGWDPRLEPGFKIDVQEEGTSEFRGGPGSDITMYDASSHSYQGSLGTLPDARSVSGSDAIMADNSPSIGGDSDSLQCEQCGRVFTGRYQNGNLARHRRLEHKGSTPLYACQDPNCNKGFNRNDSLLKHYRKKHEHHALAPIQN
jgi:serine/threonine protein kinase